MTYLLGSKLVHTSILGSRWTLLILWSLGQRSTSLGSNLPNYFRSITGEHLDLSILGSRVTLLILVSKVKVTKVKCSKTISNCLRNNCPKWISSSYICATYFELTCPDVQNICDKKSFRGIMFYKHLLFYRWLSKTLAKWVSFFC